MYLLIVEGAYLVVRIREKDRSGGYYVCGKRFKPEGLNNPWDFLPIAMHPKIVAKSNGPGGRDALIYSSTADPIKRNTAMIAVGYSEFSV